MNSAVPAHSSKTPASGDPTKPLSPLRALDYAVIQQCMHCGMCLPTCPTYDDTKLERHSPRGRIALMRAIADGDMEATKTFGEEMYYCLGCLACETACPAGVHYAELFETSRAEIEEAGVLHQPKRTLIRFLTLKYLFTRPRLLRFVGRLLWLYQVSGLQWVMRRTGLTKLIPGRMGELEPQTPRVEAKFSHQRIAPVETPVDKVRYRVALLTGCVQDLTFSSVNRDTADVLLANGCEVHTPPVQFCCGSLHGHNGDQKTARLLARRQLDMIDPFAFDAIISNAAGCGSHLKHYDHLLENDPAYAARAVEWSKKLKDIHEWLSQIGIRKAKGNPPPFEVTYHEACHLCHGQKITRQPREVLRAIPGLQLVELTESTWCCGSAGIYNITQPEMAAKLQKRKMGHIQNTAAPCVTTANTGCLLQLINGAKLHNVNVTVKHPITLLAEAYRNEKTV